MSNIHPTAVIDSSAEIAAGARIGPYCVIGANVFIDEDTEIASHVVISSNCKIGKRNKIYSYAALGGDPQDKKYQNEETWLEIGDDNTIREFVTFNRGTAQDAGITKIGNRNWIMANVHIAHDCVVGSDTVFANNASLAGHVHIGDKVILGGYALVYQFVHVGELAMLAFSSGVKHNVAPYSLVEGNPAQYKSINLEGLKRNQFSPEEIKNIKTAHQIIYHDNNLLKEAQDKLQNLAQESASVGKISAFLQEMDAKRGFIR